MIQFHKFSATDFDRLIGWIHSAEDAMQFAGPSLQYPISKAQLDEYILMANREAFVVYYNETPIGHCAITNKSSTNAILNHILVGDSMQRNKGYGTQIVQTMLTIIFKKMNKQVAELYVFDWNSNAIHCYQKIGFVHNVADTKVRTVNGKKWYAINMQLQAVDYVSAT